jgi:hypothetical protein
MMAEKRLYDIINAADPDDRDDVEIRTLLVAALKESSIGSRGRSRRRPASASISCEFWARQRPSSSSRRPRRAFDHRS